MSKPEPSEEVDGSPSGGEGLRDLRKGAHIQILGNVARVAHPAALALTTNLFGAERWGLFVAGQAAVELLARATLLGYDRTFAFWLPRAGSEPVLRMTLLRIALVATLISALGAGFAAGALAHWKGVPEDAWQVVALALLPRALIELLAYASAGARRMEVLVIVRDVVVQFAFFAAAWITYGMGLRDTGLPWAYVWAQWLSLGVAAAWGARLLPRDAWGPWKLGPLPPKFRRYARGMWGTDIASASLARLDSLVLAALAPPATVGLYSIAQQFGNTVRSLRGAFEPLVTAVASGLSSKENHGRLREAMTYATRVVLGLQLLVVGVPLFLGELVLPLFGEGFEAAQLTAILLCVGWTVHGSIGLSGAVVMGFGLSHWSMYTALGTLVVLFATLLALVPWLGANGAAIAVALTFGLQAVVFLVQARRLTAGRLFDGSVAAMLKVPARALLLGGLAYLFGRWAGGPLAGQLAGFVAFEGALLPSVIHALREPAPTAIPVAG